jgi:hypothetical protein
LNHIALFHSTFSGVDEGFSNASTECLFVSHGLVAICDTAGFHSQLVGENGGAAIEGLIVAQFALATL